MSAHPKVTPRRPGDRPARLDSLKNPQPRPIPQAKQQEEPEVCPNPDCSCTEFISEDNKILCNDCGTVVKEDDMVTDIQYGLGSVGNHVVHGKHVGADQAYNRDGDVFDRNRHMSSEEITCMHGNRYILDIVSSLSMAQTLHESGKQVFKLASAVNFIQGRRTKSVAAVALYIACRTQRDGHNKWMLIDFSDVLDLNVFHLGGIYKSLIEVLRMNPNGHIIHPINPEDLIFRFADRLEFGPATMRVANDAVRIVQRMNRDWMTPGRRPAGICGAALVLAARMNNFRRTVREVVYVVKVQETTIFKRLDEFRLLESSGLTVDEFRAIDLERSADPPSFGEPKDGKKKRSRKRKSVQFDDDGDDDQTIVVSSRATSTAPSEASRAALAAPSTSLESPRSQAATDSRKMPPPPLPIDPSLLQASQEMDFQTGSSPAPQQNETATTIDNDQTATLPSLITPTNTNMPSGIASASSTLPTPLTTGKAIMEPTPKKSRGRGKKATAKVVTSPSARPTADLDDESQIFGLTDPLNLEVALASAANGSTSRAAPQNILVGRLPVPMTADISDWEFADDPEVSKCLLSPAEIEIKTRIWTHENREWLRMQQAKLLKHKLAEENGTLRQVKTRKRRRRRVGDLRPYLDSESIEQGSPVAANAEEAMKKLMQVRGFSKKLNYNKFGDIYTQKSSSRTESMAGSGSPGSGFADSPGAGSPNTAVEDVATPESTRTPVEVAHGSNEEANNFVDSEAKATAGQQEEASNVQSHVDEGISDEEDDDDEMDDGDDDPYDAGSADSN